MSAPETTPAPSRPIKARAKWTVEGSIYEHMNCELVLDGRRFAEVWERADAFKTAEALAHAGNCFDAVRLERDRATAELERLRAEAAVLRERAERVETMHREADASLAAAMMVGERDRLRQRMLVAALNEIVAAWNAKPGAFRVAADLALAIERLRTTIACAVAIADTQ